MTVYKSDVITARDDADEQAEKALVGAGLRVSHAVVELAGAIANNDVIQLVDLPVNAVIHSVRFACDDLGTTGTLNVGLYRQGVVTADTDAIDEDCIATAIDVNAAAVADTEIRFEVADIATANYKAWKIAGLTAQPAYNTFTLCATAAAATTAGGTIRVAVIWSV